MWGGGYRDGDLEWVFGKLRWVMFFRGLENFEVENDLYY